MKKYIVSCIVLVFTILLVSSCSIREKDTDLEPVYVFDTCEREYIRFKEDKVICVVNGVQFEYTYSEYKEMLEDNDE